MFTTKQSEAEVTISIFAGIASVYCSDNRWWNKYHSVIEAADSFQIKRQDQFGISFVVSADVFKPHKKRKMSEASKQKLADRLAAARQQKS